MYPIGADMNDTPIIFLTVWNMALSIVLAYVWWRHDGLADTLREVIKEIGMFVQDTRHNIGALDSKLSRKQDIKEK